MTSDLSPATAHPTFSTVPPLSRGGYPQPDYLTHPSTPAYRGWYPRLPGHTPGSSRPSAGPSIRDKSPRVVVCGRGMSTPSLWHQEASQGHQGAPESARAKVKAGALTDFLGPPPAPLVAGRVVAVPRRGWLPPIPESLCQWAPAAGCVFRRSLGDPEGNPLVEQTAPASGSPFVTHSSPDADLISVNRGPGSQRGGLLHDQVTVSVRRPGWPVWS